MARRQQVGPNRRDSPNLRATDTVSLLAALDDLLDEAATAPVLLEVFTDAETDAEEQRNYYHAIKEEWKNFFKIKDMNREWTTFERIRGYSF